MHDKSTFTLAALLMAVLMTATACAPLASADPDAPGAAPRLGFVGFQAPYP